MQLKLWIDHIIGSHSEFAMEHRTYNAVNVITIVLLSIFVVTNIIFQQPVLFLIALFTLVSQVVFYYLSRYRRKFEFCIIANAFISYIAIAYTFISNNGVTGPTAPLFLLTFQLLIAVTPKNQHLIWIIKHILTFGALIALQYFYPQIITQAYKTTEEQYADAFITYVTVIVLMYFITIHLRNHFNHEKELARQRAKTILEQKHRVETSEAKVRAFFNSSSSIHLLLDKEMIVIDYNNAAAAFVQKVYHRTLVQGEPILQYINDTYKERFQNNFLQSKRGLTKFDEVSAIYNEEEIFWQVSYEPAFNEQGDIIGVAYTATNVTDKMLQENEIRTRNKALAEIAHIQSHDLRGPVASLMGLMNLIKDKNYEAPAEYLKMMEKVVNDLDTKIHEIVKKADEPS